MKKGILLLALCGAWLCTAALAEGYVVPTKAYQPVETLDITVAVPGMPTIRAQLQGGTAYLFLPAGVNPQALLIAGETVPCALADGVNTLTDAQGNAITLTVMRSANLRSAYLLSDDAEAFGRAYVEADLAHNTQAQATLVLCSAQGQPEYRGHLRQLRGRGNTTWEWAAKKPYQLKLEQKADLLHTGAANRTYLLLADCFDATLLHNSLCLDLGRALGLPAPAYEPVDLYYDGVYRGTYLLCEKPEVRAGMLPIADYQKALERLYPAADLVTATATNRYGGTYQYTQGIAADGGDTAAYLLEIDEYFYTGEPAWLSTLGGMHFSVQNPTLLSRTDGETLSDLVQRIENALKNGGVDPESGTPVSDWLDFDSLARFFLLSEWSKNPDYWKTSTYFYKPSKQDKLYAGPIWDFDIAFGIREAESGATGYLRDQAPWLARLCALPAFQEAVVTAWEQDFQPLLQALDLGAYTQRIARSAAMNFVLWPFGGGYNNINHDTVYPTWAENLTFLSNFLADRLAWMSADLAGWMGNHIRAVDVSLAYRNADLPASASLTVPNTRSNVALRDVQWSAVTDPEVPWNNRYTVTATLSAIRGCTLEADLRVRVNGCAVTPLNLNENTATLRFTFSGPRYEPALYDGENYGMLYQYDYFVAHNPEAVETCGSTAPEEVLAYFVDSGLYDELQGIETYVSSAFIANYASQMEAYFMSDPWSCADYYRQNVAAEDLLGMAQEARPTVTDQPAP